MATSESNTQYARSLGHSSIGYGYSQIPSPPLLVDYQLRGPIWESIVKKKISHNDFDSNIGYGYCQIPSPPTLPYPARRQSVKGWVLLLLLYAIMGVKFPGLKMTFIGKQKAFIFTN